MNRKDMIPNPDDQKEVDIWKEAWTKGRSSGSRYDAFSAGLNAVIEYRQDNEIEYSSKRSFPGVKY